MITQWGRNNCHLIFNEYRAVLDGAVYLTHSQVITNRAVRYRKKIKTWQVRAGRKRQTAPADFHFISGSNAKPQTSPKHYTTPAFPQERGTSLPDARLSEGTGDTASYRAWVRVTLLVLKKEMENINVVKVMNIQVTAFWAVKWREP
jgi:hypothetical protein